MTPYFSNFQEFMQMQGHGAFVWACYGITFVSLFALVAYVMSERKAVLAQLTKQMSNKQKSDRLTNKQRKELGNQPS